MVPKSLPHQNLVKLFSETDRSLLFCFELLKITAAIPSSIADNIFVVKYRILVGADGNAPRALTSVPSGTVLQTAVRGNT
jgi:hypothetical protein